MKLIIYCEECTKVKRMKEKYGVFSFDSLTEANFHITQYEHTVRIELESTAEEDE